MWGVCDDRGSNAAASVYRENNLVDSWRKFKLGDKLSAMVNTTDGWVELSLNDDEFVQRLDIPVGQAGDYQFAMTFANDHRVKIIPEGRGVLDDEPIEVNEDDGVQFAGFDKTLLPPGAVLGANDLQCKLPNAIGGPL